MKIATKEGNNDNMGRKGKQTNREKETGRAPRRSHFGGRVQAGPADRLWAPPTVVVVEAERRHPRVWCGDHHALHMSSFDPFDQRSLDEPLLGE